MARPFQSADSGIGRQAPFTQFGGNPTRETKVQQPKMGGGAPDDPQHQFLMALLKHPVLGPILMKLLLGGAQ